MLNWDNPLENQNDSNKPISTNLRLLNTRGHGLSFLMQIKITGRL